MTLELVSMTKSKNLEFIGLWSLLEKNQNFIDEEFLICTLQYKVFRAYQYIKEGRFNFYQMFSTFTK